VPGSDELQLIRVTMCSAACVGALASEQRACVLFVPPSFPPRAVAGELVSCFMTPMPTRSTARPRTWAHELRALFGPYQPRRRTTTATDDLPRLYAQLCAGTQQRLRIAEHLLRRASPSSSCSSTSGGSLSPCFLFAHRSRHPQHVPGNPFANTGSDYYRQLDRHIGQLLTAAGPTPSAVVSDHGARPLLGCIHINQWLIDHGTWC